MKILIIIKNKSNMKKILTLFAAAMISCAAMADGTQSVKVTFDGTDNANWNVSSGGTSTVANGTMDVTMAVQNGGKYRADLQYQTSGTYTMDKTKDIVWAVKLIGDIPGTSNSKKFEVNYKKDGVNTWINNINGPSGNIKTIDGNTIYYFNLGAGGLNKLSEVPEGNQTINNIHFIFADATGASEYNYRVDWVATFASVADLQAYANWQDEQGADLHDNTIVNTTSWIGYNNLNTATSSATTGDVIVVNKSFNQSDRVNCDGKTLTVQGATGNEVVTLTNSNNMLLLATNNGSTDFTVEDLILDGNNYSTDKNFIEASGKMTIKNCTIRNYTTSNGTGVVVSKGNGNLTFDGVRFENCVATTSGVTFNGRTMLFLNNIEFIDCSEIQVYVEQYLRMTIANMGWEKPLKLYRKNAADNALVLSGDGATYNTWSNKFDILNEGFRLVNTGHWTDVKLVAAPTFTTTAEVPYATFCVDYIARIPEGVKAYKATSQNGENIYFSEIEGNIPANEGVVLVSENAGTYTLQTAAEADAVTGNILVGTTVEMAAPANCYAMSKSQSQAEATLVFAHFTGTIPANKAYFTGSSSAKMLAVFGEDNETTGITSLEASTGSAQAYNLAGQRVNANAKGIVIVDGKKYLNK